MPTSKQLIVVGNSLALIIERPILRALHYTRKTKFKIFTDGLRLILEPESEPREAPPEQGLAVQSAQSGRLSLSVRRASSLTTARELMHRGLNMDRMDRVGAGYTEVLVYVEHLQCRETLDPVLEMVMDRLEHVVAALTRDEGWDAAISAACLAVPLVPGAGELGAPYERLRD